MNGRPVDIRTISPVSPPHDDRGLTSSIYLPILSPSRLISEGTKMEIKKFLALVAALLATTIAVADPPENTGARLTLLGTGGGPIARTGRSQPASVLRVAGKTYLIDVGAGTERQLVRAGVRLNEIDTVLITHLHFDHIAGLPSFIALDWQDRRRLPVAVIGPPGTRVILDDALRFLSTGEAIFAPQLPDLKPITTIFSARDIDITDSKLIFSDDTVKVFAVENSHYSTMQLPARAYGRDRSYSYRFETASQSIVFTGDTGPSSAVEKLANGADVLVSEIIDLPALMESLKKRSAATGIDQQSLIDHMAQEHLTPENVGKLAAASKAKRVVLTHFATPPGIEAIDRERILGEIRKHYSGPVSFGEDLATY